ncbi:MAG: hypothetical protein ABL932_02515 [Terricaulis sp.]
MPSWPVPVSPPWPLIEVAIAPRSATDADLLQSALSRLVDETKISFARHETTFLLGGLSELHLEIAIEGLRRGGNPEFVVGAPQIAYREVLGCAVHVDYVYKRLFDVRREFARVVIDFAPLATGSGFIFKNAASGAVPEEFVSGVEKGLQIARENGVRAGFPLIDFVATLSDGAYHDIESSAFAFQKAAYCAVQELKEKGNVQLAEPFMTVELCTSEKYLGAIVSDLESRRGMIENQSAKEGVVILNASVPLANMYGYKNTLNAISERRATHVMGFCEYRLLSLPDDDPPFPPAVGMRA